METIDDYNPRVMWRIFYEAQKIVAHHRQWYQDLYYKYELHEAVRTAMDLARPHNWQQLLLERPHVSQTDPNRLAYTRDERAGMADKQTVTTIGKYLARHFDLPDHEIRDIVARHTCNDEFKIVCTTDEMVHAVNHGPSSCMCWRDSRGVECDDGVRRHPYAVYDPQYGWHMALRINPSTGDIDGRALCVNDEDAGDKYFVRSFKRCPNGGYSYSDEMLEAWLKARGYKHRSCYLDGTQLAKYKLRGGGGFLAPYIDGDTATVEDKGKYLVIMECGDYECTETDGTVKDASMRECDDCGAHEHEDDMHFVGRHQDRCVCSSCANDNYRTAISYRGQEYEIHDNDCVYVESQDAHYHVDYLSENHIVELDNGDYEHIDNAVCIDDRWYHIDHEDVVRCEDDDEFRIRDEGCWQCEESEFWYSDDIDYVEIDGLKYHPDHAPEQTETDESN